VLDALEWPFCVPQLRAAALLWLRAVHRWAVQRPGRGFALETVRVTGGHRHVRVVITAGRVPAGDQGSLVRRPVNMTVSARACHGPPAQRD